MHPIVNDTAVPQLSAGKKADINEKFAQLSKYEYGKIINLDGEKKIHMDYGYVQNFLVQIYETNHYGLDSKLESTFDFINNKFNNLDENSKLYVLKVAQLLDTVLEINARYSKEFQDSKTFVAGQLRSIHNNDKLLKVIDKSKYLAKQIAKIMGVYICCVNEFDEYKKFDKLFSKSQKLNTLKYEQILNTLLDLVGYVNEIISNPLSKAVRTKYIGTESHSFYRDNLVNSVWDEKFFNSAALKDPQSVKGFLG